MPFTGFDDRPAYLLHRATAEPGHSHPDAQRAAARARCNCDAAGRRIDDQGEHDHELSPFAMSTSRIPPWAAMTSTRIRQAAVAAAVTYRLSSTAASSPRRPPTAIWRWRIWKTYQVTSSLLPFTSSGSARGSMPLHASQRAAAEYGKPSAQSRAQRRSTTLNVQIYVLRRMLVGLPGAA